MIALTSLIPLLIAFFLTIAEAQQKLSERVHEGAIYLRMLMLAIAAALIAVGLSEPVGTVAVLFSLLLISVFLFASHLIARKLAGGGFASGLDRGLQRIYLAWQELFKLFALPNAPDPEEFEKEFMQSIEDFGETVVREVMVPRIDIRTIDSTDTLEVALSAFVSSGHSRLPVTGDGPDDIRGVLFLKDIAKTVLENPAKLQTETAEENSRTAVFVPESKPVVDLLQQMQSSQTQLALIIDEYGGIAGMVTMEDLIEELVGEISDEYDRELDEIAEIGNNLYRIHPRMTLSDFGEHFDLEIDDEDVDTVSGLIIKLLDSLPRGGERVSAYNFEFVAERVDVKRGRLGSILAKRIDD